MDAAGILGKSFYGLAKYADVNGFPYTVARPNPADPANPLSYPVAALNVAVAGDAKFTKPMLFGKPVGYAALDGAQTEVGDYLTPGDGSPIYFIAQMTSRGIVVVRCNAALRLIRTNDPGGIPIGAGPYSGITDTIGAATDALGAKMPFTGWPCSMVLGKGAERFTGAVPSSPRTMPGWEILLPASIPATPVLGDIFLDITERRYSVQQAEQSELGWRVIAAEVHA